MRTMNKYFFFAAAFVALASCSNDSFVGDNSPTMGGESGSGGAIVFSSGANGTTRANSIGADAAALLSNHFTVGGFKGDGSTHSTVFDNYIVNWTANTAGRTESNTSDWEYVGISAALPSTITGLQTIKFWDYSATQYDFVAYSTGARTATTGEPVSGTSVKVTAIDPAHLTTAAYTLKGASRTDLAGCYVADMVTAYKSDNPATFGKEVTLTFRNLASKVRMAIYETVPGYSVKDVKFYTAHPSTLGSGSAVTAALIGTMNDAGTYTVNFPTIGSSNKNNADYNRAHVTFASTATSTNQTYGSLNYVAKESREKTGTAFLGRTSSNPSYAGTSPYYQTVLPNETGVVFELAIDYTLESIDGSGEEIHVYGATAYVPVQFTKWQPNFAYTYIFKISDNSNGWTSTVATDPAGLYPITFDAVVAEAIDANTDQSTITTVASPSITTYQKGHDTTKDEYSAATGAIYVQVMVDGTLKSDLDTKGHLYTVTTTDAAISEATVLDALNIIETGTTGRNGITLTAETSTATITTIPGEDGNNISVNAGEAAEFTPEAPTSSATVKYYAYVYDTKTWNGIAVKYATEPTDWTSACYTDKACTTLASGTFSSETTYYRKQSYIYTAETMTSETAPSDWTTAGVWWKDSDGKTAVGAWDTANNGKVFYKRYTANAQIYGVKVIKVVD